VRLANVVIFSQLDVQMCQNYRRRLYTEVIGLTLTERIWGIIVETANAIDEFAECDPLVDKKIN